MDIKRHCFAYVTVYLYNVQTKLASKGGSWMEYIFSLVFLSITKLCVGIFFYRSNVFALVLKHSASVGEEHIWDTVICEYLSSSTAICKCFFFIAKPIIRGSIHLYHLACIITSRTSGVCIFNIDCSINNSCSLFLRFYKFFKFLKVSCYFLSCSPFCLRR